MKQTFTRVLLRVSRTRPVRRFHERLLIQEPQFVIPILAWTFNDRARLRTARVPDRVNGFEDLSFLFTSSRLNVGVALMTFNEAAYLWKLVRSLGENPTIAEIGRFKGGSTIIIASSMNGGELYSYDAHFRKEEGAELDRQTEAALDQLGLAGRVHLIVADSTVAELPPHPCDLILIDGGHDYGTARGDFDHWKGALRSGGHLLFHDAVDRDGFCSYYPDVGRVVSEVASEGFARVDAPDSFAHLVKP